MEAATAEGDRAMYWDPCREVYNSLVADKRDHVRRAVRV